MSLDRRGIERQGDCIFAKPRQGLKNCSPPVTFGPAVEAIVDRRIRAISVRAIAPSGSRLQHVNDAADDAPVVVALRSRQSIRQVRLKTRPLPVTQPKQSIKHSFIPESMPGSGNHVMTIRYRP